MRYKNKYINIYGDESSHTGHRYMVLGTIWENPICAVNLERDVQKIRVDKGFHKEFHWKQIKGHQVRVYCALIDLFKRYLDQGLIKFRAIVVDQSDPKHKQYSDNNELHFYKMWFWLLHKRLDDAFVYDIYLDRKTNSVPGRLSDLHRNLDKWHPGIVRRLEALDGSQVQLQMADVLAGAIAYYHNGHYKSAQDTNPKLQVFKYACQTIGSALIACHGPYDSPSFNMWCFKR